MVEPAHEQESKEAEHGQVPARPATAVVHAAPKLHLPPMQAQFFALQRMAGNSAIAELIANQSSQVLAEPQTLTEDGQRLSASAPTPLPPPSAAPDSGNGSAVRTVAQRAVATAPPTHSKPPAAPKRGRQRQDADA